MLEAIAYTLPDVGYCQGMNFIVSVLLTVLDSEEDSFWVFLYFLEQREMKPLFLPVILNIKYRGCQSCT